MYYKPKKGERDGVPTITVPRTLTQCTYINVPLAALLASKGYDKVMFEIDSDTKEIRISRPSKAEKGYSVVRTGRRGWGVSPKLRRVLPAGRYRLTDARSMVFARG